MSDKSHKPTLIVIAGPTASGKTGLAIDVARHFNTEIISADSRQFYREIPIGTAAPSGEQLNQVPHHFVGNLSIQDEYNVSRYEKEVLALLDEKFKENNLMLMVGGSGLYINAVCNGIDELPDPDPVLRDELNAIFQQKGIAALQESIRQLDPEYFEQVDQNNPKRLLRAIEVCRQSGKTSSHLHRNQPVQRNFNILKIGLELPREILNQHINQRTDKMLQRGWLEEARAVFPYRHLNALNTVGFKELFAYLDGKWPLEQAIEKIKTNTRRYAKRQMTWFRKDTDIHWLAPKDLENMILFIKKMINQEK